ncbi:MAG: hypothetical protein GY832_37315 [Chloroflexi bacterium]|nr:hypothetical protein [Chloroflexota bacterium]
MYIEALLEMGQCRVGWKEYEKAIRWYTHALEANELRETFTRALWDVTLRQYGLQRLSLSTTSVKRFLNES